MSKSRFTAPEDSPGFLLWHLTLRWQRAITAALAPFDLTHVQFVALTCADWLDEHAGAPSQVDIARQAGIDPKMVSPVLQRLERAGLLTRVADPADARARRIAVTPQGRSVAAKAIAAVERTDATFFGDEKSALDRLVRVVKAVG